MGAATLRPATGHLPRFVWLAPLFLLGATLFALAYCQAPLYYSNQNQYFLHGLAAAGEGLLAEDWLANTKDPTPIFSALVAFTASYLPLWTFHVYQGLLLGVYAASMLGLFVAVVGNEKAARRWPVFVAAFVLVHSAFARWLSYQVLPLDYPWYFQAGVAGQYILGAMLQPSTFGVLLVAAIALFAHSRPFLAASCIGVAATVHSTYLLPGALLTLGFLTALVVEKRTRLALALGAYTLALVLPMTVYVVLTFGPTSAAQFAEAQDIVANFRIPHHARPDLWLDPVAAAQLAWVGLAVLLVRRTPLFYVLGVPFVLMLALTLLVVATGSNTLALLFPWRISAILVPVATTVVFSRLVGAVWGMDNPLLHVGAALVVFGLAGVGVKISLDRLAFRSNDDELPVMDFVRRTRKPGDVYFLPVQLPNLTKTTRGSLSSDFKPLAERKTDKRIIPIGFQRFRLYTGTPIFVDFKSIPYKDVEVIEWRKRLYVAKTAQETSNGWFCYPPESLIELRRLGVTHLLLPGNLFPLTTMAELKWWMYPGWQASVMSPFLVGSPVGEWTLLLAETLTPLATGLEIVYRDPHYAVYRFVPFPGRMPKG